VISVPTHTGSGAGRPRAVAPCPLDTAVLERRGAGALRTAGLAPMTLAESIARERANMEEDRRRLRALQAGDLEGARQRPGAVVSTLGVPALKVSMVAEGIGDPGSGIVCSVAAFATFLAPPRGWRTIVAANGVEVGAHLLLWQPPPHLVVVPAAELEAAAGATLDRLVAEFVTAWREQNAR
jgi:hypothetical protein